MAVLADISPTPRIHCQSCTPETHFCAGSTATSEPSPGARAAGLPTPAPDPYAVWISEIMLQQTRVETAIPYYERFLARFPGRRESGAGRRGRGPRALVRPRILPALPRAARRRAGDRRRRRPACPRSARELERLPGIGPYTAAAIASIAFAEPVPVLDGNVERVVCRYGARSAGARSEERPRARSSRSPRASSSAAVRATATRP